MKTCVGQYPEIFHYTDKGGVLGIVASQTIRATHYSYLNDTTEMLCLEKFLINDNETMVGELLKTMGRNEEELKKRCLPEAPPYHFTRKTIELLRDALLEEKIAEPYTASFWGPISDYESKNGTLSQFARYGEYALVFDTKKMKELLESEKSGSLYALLELDSVAYTDEDISKKYKDEFQQIKKFTSWMIPNWFNSVFAENSIDQAYALEIVATTLPSYMSCMPKVKQQGFKEEREIRIAALVPHEKYTQGMEYRKKEVKTRFNELRNMDVKYIELFKKKLPARVKRRNILPIERVIVGPCADKYEKAESLRRDLGRMQIEVTISETPLVL